jgi:hypothetical protein
MAEASDDPVVALRQHRESRREDAEREVTHVRRVGRKVVEVYETVRASDGEVVETATVLRRSKAAGWRVESEAPAVPDAGVVRLLLASPPGLVPLVPGRFGPRHQEIFGVPAAATPDGEGLTLQLEDATVRVRVVPAGPVAYVPQFTRLQREFYEGRTHVAVQDEARDAETLTAAGAAVRSAVELSVTLPPDRRDRWDRAVVLGEMDNAAATMIDLLDVSMVVPGGSARQLTPQRFAALNRYSHENEFNCYAMWCGVHRVDGHLVTDGLRRFALPELEMAVPSPAVPSQTHPHAAAAQLLADLGFGSLRAEGYTIGDRVGPDGDTLTHRIAAGRLGPAPTRSYGRWGSQAVEPLDGGPGQAVGLPPVTARISPLT